MDFLLLLLLFTGLFMIMYGLYENKIYLVKKAKMIKYKFIPRSYYEEQLYNRDFDSKIKNIYEVYPDERYIDSSYHAFPQKQPHERSDRELTVENSNELEEEDPVRQSHQFS
jgi:hypothetical protein